MMPLKRLKLQFNLFFYFRFILINKHQQRSFLIMLKNILLVTYNKSSIKFKNNYLFFRQNILIQLIKLILWCFITRYTVYIYFCLKCLFSFLSLYVKSKKKLLFKKSDSNFMTITVISKSYWIAQKFTMHITCV